ncbi:MAG: TRAP transporter large permease subunit [Chloroflexi bacterium]|nr:TRAP transporter large permease subunit [Chloroflexota bacterium]
MAIAVAFSLMTVFFLAGLYVAGAIGTLSLIMMEFFSDAPLWNIMPNRVWETYTRFLLVAIPLFVLMGELILRSGVADQMYKALDRWVGPIPGGLLHTNIASCAIFAACSGSSIATAATISRVALPSFRARGYNERLVVGSLAAGGTLGILIPPSVLLVLYGLTTGTSIGRLFLAGFLPGALMAGTFMLMIAIAAIIWPGIAPKTPGDSYTSLKGWRERILGTVAVVPVAILIFLVLGSIYAGWATPTEAAAAGVSGAFIIAVMNQSYELIFNAFALACRKMGLLAIIPQAMRQSLETAAQQAEDYDKNLIKQVVASNFRMLTEAFMGTIKTTGMIMFILMAAFTLQFAFAYLRISEDMARFVVSLDLSSVQLILIIVVFYLVLGTFMESYSMMLTTLPLIVPTLTASGIDLLWFGIIMIILLEAAQISPPQGLSLFALHGAQIETQQIFGDGTEKEKTINDVYIGVLPFMACMALVIGILMVFPEIATWLPDKVKGAR